MTRSGIYAIENKLDSKRYVGSAVNIEQRWKEHKARLRSNSHPNKRLQTAYNQDGETAFQFSVIEECPRDTLHLREQHWLDTWDCVHTGYNLAPRAGTVRGVRRASSGHVRAGTYINLSLTDEAHALLTERTTPHRRGRYVSQLIEDDLPAVSLAEAQRRVAEFAQSLERRIIQLEQAAARPHADTPGSEGE